MSNKLALHFVGRIERARDSLAGLRLSRYADEICTMVPRDVQSFERFVTYAETLAATVNRWSADDRVRSSYAVGTLNAAVADVNGLASEARKVWTLYQAQKGA